MKLFNEQIAVECEIAWLAGISGHADKIGLKNWLGAFDKKPEIVFLNHGEHEVMEDFGGELRDAGYHVEMPYSGTSFDLVSGQPTEITEGLRLKSKKEHREEEQRAAAEKELILAIETLNKLLTDQKLSAAELHTLADEVKKAAENVDYSRK